MVLLGAVYSSVRITTNRFNSMVVFIEKKNGTRNHSETKVVNNLILNYEKVSDFKFKNVRWFATLVYFTRGKIITEIVGFSSFIFYGTVFIMTLGQKRDIVKKLILGTNFL